jgi:TATA-box binding protein (TBP) (component of TFIID and TFIIIB)
MDPKLFQYTPLRISTNVATGNVGTPLSLDKLFEQLPPLLIPFGYPDEGILKMEHKDKVLGASTKDLLTKKKSADKTFFNQATIVVRKKREGSDTDYKEVNLKIFGNGGIQITGITGLEFARITLEWLLPILNQLPQRISENPLYIKSLTIQLINSDYHINAAIHRDRLHEILSDEYRLFSTFEKLIHQGVNLKYYYNTMAPINRPKGICHCSNPCTGQGTGEGEGQCKKITVLIFQTGDIIVTGARRREQLDEAYHYMNEILRKHSMEVLRPIGK